MLGTSEVYHFESQPFLLEVLLLTEYDVEGNLAESFSLLPRDYPVELHVALAEPGHRDAHCLQCVGVNDIKPATIVH